LRKTEDAWPARSGLTNDFPSIVCILDADRSGAVECSGRVFPDPNRPQSLYALNSMSDPHLPAGSELCPQPAPGFCSRCRKSFAESVGLAICPNCGDRLMPQGYCPVCEDYWALPVGVPCPKHDLPLDALGPPRLQLDFLGKPVHWVTVCHFTDSQAAQAPRIRLEAEGIPTFVDGERMGSRSMYHVATGGVRLRVPDSLAPDARIILSQTWSALAAELDLEAEYEDEPEQPQPENHFDSASDAISLRKSLVFFLSVGLPALLLLYLILRHWLSSQA
jgi:hypothetical protein